MQTHNLKRKTRNKKRITVGRGGTRGKTSGRGTKGQNARAGRKKRPELRDIIKTIPKLRGRGVHGGKSFYKKPLVLNLDTLQKHFSASAVVTPAELARRGFITAGNGSELIVKILGDGEISKKLTIKGCSVSKAAREKIEKAGGMVQ